MANYSRESESTLTSTAADLSTIYDAGELSDVATINGVYVGQGATQAKPVHEFKNDAGANTLATFTMVAKATTAPSVYPVKLQIYNTSTGWELMTSDTTSAANVDFTLGIANKDISANYKDGSNLVVCRVYQDYQSAAGITLRQAYGAVAASVGSVAVQQNDLIVVGFLGYTSGDDNDPPSDGVNTYSKAGFLGSTSDFGRIGMYYAKATTTTTLTVTVPTSFSSYPRIIVHVYYGQDLTTPLDNALTYMDTGTPHATGDLALSASSGIMVAIWGQEYIDSNDSGADSWVIRNALSGEGTAFDSLDKSYSSSGNYTASMTGYNRAYGCIFAGFK